MAATKEDLDRRFVERVDLELLESGDDPETLQALFDFAALMFNEVTGRANVIDTKGIAALGWAIALIAFLLAFATTGPATPRWLAALLGLCAAPALIAIVLAY